MPAELNQNTLSVTAQGEHFTFRIPSPFDQIALGVRERDIVRRTDPEGIAEVSGLDAQTQWLLRCLATFELLLVSTSAAWPYSKGPDGKPVVNSQAFPPQSIAVVMEVTQGFQTALDSFLFGGTEHGESSGPEGMAGQPNTA